MILAAGKGSRIKPFSDHFPKPLLPLLDRPLLVWQIEAMRDLGIREIVVVIGHLGHRVVQSLGDGEAFGVRIRYVEQEEMLGIAHAVAQLDRHVDHPFLMFLGDIFFETRDLGSMLELFGRDGVDGVLAVKEETDRAALRRNFTVEVDDEGYVHRVVEKPRFPRTTRKGCGLYLFDPSVFDAIRRTPRTALRDEYELTESIQIYIDSGHKVLPASVVERDLNLSVPSDLLDLNLHLLRKIGEPNYVAPSAELASKAQLDSCVVMSDARILGNAQLSECVVLPGEVVRGGAHRRVVFANGVEVPCDS